MTYWHPDHCERCGWELMDEDKKDGLCGPCQQTLAQDGEEGCE